MKTLLQFLLSLLCISVSFSMESTTNIFPLIGNNYITINDTDGSRFEIKRLFPTNGQVSSCYELKRDKRISQFCYPGILVAGVAKCGTSAMYSFLIKQNGLEPGNRNKEYCPRKITFYDYFNGFAYSPNKIGVNGCLDTNLAIKLHQILQPTAAYIIMVRDLPERVWAVYNFWCIQTHENCGTDSTWTNLSFFRSPKHFHELLLSANYPRSKVSES